MLDYIQKALRAFRREEGQALVEYALILALVSVASIGLLTALGTDIGAVFSYVSGQLQGAIP